MNASVHIFKLVLENHISQQLNVVSNILNEQLLLVYGLRNLINYTQKGIFDIKFISINEQMVEIFTKLFLKINSFISKSF
ncbi:hypothetical protein CR513_19410, partial [Mucuna pruriens]